MTVEKGASTTLPIGAHIVCCLSSTHFSLESFWKWLIERCAGDRFVNKYGFDVSRECIKAFCFPLSKRRKSLSYWGRRIQKPCAIIVFLSITQKFGLFRYPYSASIAQEKSHFCLSWSLSNHSIAWMEEIWMVYFIFEMDPLLYWNSRNEILLLVRTFLAVWSIFFGLSISIQTLKSCGF